MSDFLNFVDEIIDGTPKYNVTDNVDGTKSIELANEIVQEGTPLNKLKLSEVNSIMGYNKCISNIEQVILPKDYVLVKADTITPTWTSGGLNHNKISFEFENIIDNVLGTYKPTLEISNEAGVNFTDSSVSNRINVSSVSNGYSRYTSTNFLSNMKNTISSSYYNVFSYNGIYNKLIYFDFDFKHNEANKIINYSVGHSSRNTQIISKIYYSDDGVNYTIEKENLFTCSTNNFESFYYNIQVGNHRYYRLEISTTSDYFWFGNFSANVQTFGTSLINNLLTQNNFNFIDNRILKIETPNFDLTNVVGNTIDGIYCDTILQPSTKYELIYNEDTNKFELGGNLTLYDITLTELVNQIDLTGISDMLKEDKMYKIIIDGYSSSTSNTNVKFGGNSNSLFVILGGTNYSNCIETSFFYINNKNKRMNNNEDIQINLIFNDNTIRNSPLKSNGTNYEYITFDNPLKIGTRIIIKEIS